EQTDQFLALSGFERLGPGTLAAIVCAKAPEDGPIACFGQAELQGTSVMGGPFAHQKTVTFQGVQECRQGSPTHTGDLGRGLGLHGPGQPESEDHPKPRPGQSPWSVDRGFQIVDDHAGCPVEGEDHAHGIGVDGRECFFGLLHRVVHECPEGEIPGGCGVVGHVSQLKAWGTCSVCRFSSEPCSACCLPVHNLPPLKCDLHHHRLCVSWLCGMEHVRVIIIKCFTNCGGETAHQE